MAAGEKEQGSDVVPVLDASMEAGEAAAKRLRQAGVKVAHGSGGSRGAPGGAED